MQMRTVALALLGAIAAAGTALAIGSASATATRLNTAEIEKLTGGKGTLDEASGVFKITAPRDDLNVMAEGVHVTPAMGLTSWAAFKEMRGRTMVMGDLTLSEDQVNPVMSVALDQGLAVTALHNHFFWDRPRVMFMHIEGTGTEPELASAVGKVFAKINATEKEPLDPPSADIDPARTTLDPKKVDAILGTQGTLSGGVYKAVFGRTTRMHGDELASAMGVNTWAAFAGSDQQAVVDGDFAVHESELQGVLKALRHNDIDVVAIHQHMIHEEPRILFLHYWGVGPTANLARGLRAALDQTRG